MIFAIVVLSVLSLFNTFVILTNSGRAQLNLNSAVDALCGASNILSRRIGTLEGVVVNAVDCLVTIDARDCGDLEEE